MTEIMIEDRNTKTYSCEDFSDIEIVKVSVAVEDDDGKFDSITIKSTYGKSSFTDYYRNLKVFYLLYKLMQNVHEYLYDTFIQYKKIVDEDNK